MTPSPTHNLEAVRIEIERLHRFLEQWLNGALDWSDEVFEDGIGRRLHPNFINIQPAGIVLSCETILDQIRSGHGRSPDFRIRIRNVQLHQVLDDKDMLLATYEEYQRGARNSARPDNARLSTALFAEIETGALEWRHIHETWLPEEAHAPERFDF